MSWYYVQDKQKRGPVSDEQISALIQSGQIAPDCQVWQSPMPAWKRVRDVFELPAELASPRPRAAPARVPKPVETAVVLPPEPVPAPLKFQFTGTWRGYFRVWIPGAVLTILTLGLYAPWAKVRNKRYLYAHTRLGDDGFDYRGNPRRILIGNLIVAALFAFWVFSGFLHPRMPYILIGLGVLVLPWVVAQSIRFNARATVWRGLHFGFEGSSWECLRFFVLFPLVCLGVFWPAVSRLQRRWLVTRHHYGSTSFTYETPLSEIYTIYLKSLVFFLPAGLCYLGLLVRHYIERESALSPDGVSIPYWLGNLSVVGPEILPFMVVVALGGIDFLRAQLFTLHWNGTTLGPHVFQAYMAPWDAFKMRLLHTGATIFSFGLLWPWVKVHNRIFMLDCISFAPASALGDLTAGARGCDRADALADAASDFLDLDIGL